MSPWIRRVLGSVRHCWERGQAYSKSIAGITIIHTEIHFGYKAMVSEMDSMDLALIRKSFSYVEPCLRQWEMHRPLRERAIKGNSLVVQESGKANLFAPSLANISLNYVLLKGFTSHMSTSGVICTSLVDPVKAAVKAFYALMQCDVDSDAGVAQCHSVAKSIKKMLFVIRRKWRKWEMPRVPYMRLR